MSSLKQKDFFPLLMILLILIIFSFLVFNFIEGLNVFKIKRDETVIQSETEDYLLTALPNDPVKGDVSSIIAIYLFADYENKELEEILNIIDSLMNKHKDEIHLVWKDLPLTKNYFSKGAALAARCAMDEGKYWDYNKKLLNREKSLSLDLYQKIAQDIGLNMEDFLSCYKSGKYLYDIENNLRESYVLDIEEVPVIFINQEKITGRISLEMMDEIIANLIK